MINQQITPADGVNAAVEFGRYALEEIRECSECGFHRLRGIEEDFEFKPYLREDHNMSKLEQIKKAIQSLPEEEFVLLRKWFPERDWEKWDKELKEDSRAGKLDFLIKEALEEKKEGKLRDL